jgi:hypothetical protein
MPGNAVQELHHYSATADMSKYNCRKKFFTLLKAGLSVNYCSLFADEDECILGTNNCNPSERCVNNPGSFWCNPVCRVGYQLDPQNSQNCIDIDECQEKVDTCHRTRER